MTALLIRPDGYAQWASTDHRPEAAAALVQLDRMLDDETPTWADPEAADAVLTW